MFLLASMLLIDVSSNIKDSYIAQAWCCYLNIYNTLPLSFISLSFVQKVVLISLILLKIFALFALENSSIATVLSCSIFAFKLLTNSVYDMINDALFKSIREGRRLEFREFLRSANFAELVDNSAFFSYG